MVPFRSEQFFRKEITVTIPIPLNSFGEGDDDSYAWSTRVSKGANQFLLDLMAEWQLQNKSQTLAVAVQFLYTYLDKITEDTDTEFSEKFRARLEFIKSQQEADTWDQILADLANRMVRIEKTDHAGIRTQLEETAKRFAKAYGVPWPPPDLPLISYDSEARYILDRIIAVASKNKTNRISSRDLLQNCHWISADLMPVLERLAQYDHISLEREDRSGPPTVWITVPTMSVSKIQSDHLRDEGGNEPF